MTIDIEMLFKEALENVGKKDCYKIETIHNSRSDDDENNKKPCILNRFNH